MKIDRFSLVGFAFILPFFLALAEAKEIEKPTFRGDKKSFFWKTYVEPEQTPLEVSFEDFEKTLLLLYEKVNQPKQEDLSDPAPKPELPTSYREFMKGLGGVCLPPKSYTNLPIVNWLNAIGIGSFFQDTTKKILTQPQSFTCFNSMNEYNVWVQPFGFHASSDVPQDWRFNINTFGVSVGGSRTFSNRFVLGVGTGFLHTGIHWKKSEVGGHLNAIFFGPYLGYLFDKGYTSVMVMGMWDRYSLERSVTYPIEDYRMAKAVLKNSHHSWDAIAKWEGAFDIQMSASFSENFFLRPNVGIDFLSVFEKEYSEKEESKEVFKVEDSVSTFLRSIVALEMRKEYFKSEVGCFVSSLNIGWVWMQPLSESSYKFSVSCRGDMKKDYESSSQLLLGVKLTGIHKRAVSFSIDLSTQLLGKYRMQMGRLILGWDW